MSKIKVVIVEDSKLMQEIISKILVSDPNIEVVGIADDPLIAREIIKKTNPDVLTLDIMLPHMDGITFLKNLLRLRPMPVVMVSTLTEDGSALAIEAMAIGAVEYLPKPKQKESNDFNRFSEALIKAVKNASCAHVARSILPQTSEDKLQQIMYKSNFLKNEVIAIGASTGGIEALETILLQLPQVIPPIIIVQHIKKEFGSAFSKRVNRLYGLLIIEATDNREILPGYIYMAPSESHLTVTKQGGRYLTFLKDLPPVNNHKPSIDVLFKSIAKAAGSNAIGILLTGMGSDGALGLKEIKMAGGITIVQDQASSVVWGMPGSAVKLNAADFIVALNKIPQKILQIMDNKMLGIKNI